MIENIFFSLRSQGASFPSFVLEPFKALGGPEKGCAVRLGCYTFLLTCSGVNILFMDFFYSFVSFGGKICRLETG